MGRPSSFDTKYAALAEKVCKLGATDAQLADVLGISESTLNKWKLDFPAFSEALKKGKAIADADVAASLYHRATGYEHDDVHISNYQGEVTKTPIRKHYPPDPTSMIFWLKNRRPDLWRDRMEHTGRDGGPIETAVVKDEELARWLAFEQTQRVIQKAKA